MKKEHFERLKIVGRNIAYLRKLRGYSQLEFSEKCHISRVHLSNIEAPKVEKSVSICTLMDIADALEVPIEQLFKSPFEDKRD